MAQTKSKGSINRLIDADKTDPRRQAALETALANVERQYGKGSAMRLGDRPMQDVEAVSYTHLTLPTN